MNGYVPPGHLLLRSTLARVGETLCPEAWARAKPEDKTLLRDGANSDRVPWGFWTLPGSIGVEAYEALRRMLAEGRLSASIRKVAGAPEPIRSEAWQARGADRLEDVLKGAVAFTVASGQDVIGDVLIKVSDLEAALTGGRAPSPIMPHEPGPTERPAPLKAAGRPPNPNVDQFWIEVCRVMLNGEAPADQAGLTKHLSVWAGEAMKPAYEEETIRKKVGRLFAALGRK